jgi:mannose-1-phosphate guanylyltransferase
MNYAVILAGGRGTRFWPQSRTAKPKQLLQIIGDRSLLQQTADRVSPLVPLENVIVLGNEILREAIARQLPGVPKANLISEPVGHNTAPCIGLAAHLIARRDPEATLMVLPSDHLIARPDIFLDRLREAAAVAQQDESIVVMGLTPTRPETGYGYVRTKEPRWLQSKGVVVYAVETFVEKPDRPTAERYLAEGNYYWNGGIFVWKAKTIIHAIERYLPATHRALQKIAERAETSDFENTLKEWYPQTDSISVDYGVLEKATNIFCVVCDMGWNDLGSWQALYEVSGKNDEGNAMNADGLAIDAHGNLVRVAGKKVALVGVDNLIIVETEDALLVCDRNRSQDVSRLVKELERRGLKDLL